MEDGISCILHFLIFSGGGPPEPPSPPLIKGIHQLNPQNLSSTTTAAKGKKKRKKKKELESPSLLKQSTRNLCLNYTETEKKEEGAGVISFLCDWAVWNFDLCYTEDKVCDSCIVNSWALLIFLRCLWWLNSNFLCCVITQTGESSRGLLSVTNRKALAPGGHNPPEPPLKHNYITTSHFLTTRPAAGCWLGEKVSTW